MYINAFVSIFTFMDITLNYSYVRARVSMNKSRAWNKIRLCEEDVKQKLESN